MPTAEMQRELASLGITSGTSEKCKRCGANVERWGKQQFNLPSHKRSPNALHMFSCGESEEDEVGGGELPPVPIQREREELA